MAIGTITVVKKALGGSVLRMDTLQFAADGAYPTGGTAAFETAVRDALDVGSVDVLGIIPNDCGGYVPVYDQANDKLKVYYSNSDAADGPLIEVPNTTNLSGVTFNLVVVSK